MTGGGNNIPLDRFGRFCQPSAMRILLAILLMTSTAAADVSAKYFGAAWCQPCQRLKPSLARLQRSYDVTYVDAGNASTRATVQQYRISTIPAIVFLDDGVEIDRIIGSSGDWERRCVERLAGRNSWRPIRAAVRVRCGNGIGSGVILSSVPGNTVIATAAHIVRDGGQVSADVFGDGGKIRTYPATTATVSNTFDIALIVVASNKFPLPTIIAGDATPAVGDVCWGVGSSRGGKPSVMKCQVVSLDGGDVFASGAPVEGRSGGGLFNRQFELIGICSAQNKSRNDGWYVSAAKLKALLEEWEPAQYRSGIGVGIGLSLGCVTGPCRNPNCRRCYPPQPPRQVIRQRGTNGAIGPQGPAGRPGKDGTPADVSSLLRRIEALEKQKRRVILVDGKSKAVIDDESYAADEPILIDIRQLER